MQEAQDQQAYVTKIRRMLHEIPELAWEEKESLRLIKREIAELSKTLPVSLFEKEGGLYVDVTVNPTYQRLLFRADIDALPIEELNAIPYRSKHRGCMHACGHDGHAAILLGVLRALPRLKLQHNLRLVWQRAEEVYRSGAKRLIEEGVLEGIQSAYALHLSSRSPSGLLAATPGAALASTDLMTIEMGCGGGHVMAPQLGSNAIDIAVEVHAALRGIAERVLGPAAPLVMIPTISQAGTVHNVRPSRARLVYSLRTFLDEEQLLYFVAKVEARIRAVVASHGDAQLTLFRHERGHPRLINDAQALRWVKGILQENLVLDPTPFFAGDDFAYYLHHVPGCYVYLGAAGNTPNDHHQPYFTLDENVFAQGVAFFLSLATASEPEH